MVLLFENGEERKDDRLFFGVEQEEWCKRVVLCGCICMSFVNLEDRLSLIDFLDGILEYLPKEQQEEALTFLQRSRDEALVSQDELLEQAKRQAVLSWPARRAVERFVARDGAVAEWEAMLDVTRPTTAYLLRRFRDRTNVNNVSELLSHPESHMALQGEERSEVELVRPEIWADLWHHQVEGLDVHEIEAKKEFEGLYQRLQKLRQFAASASQRKELEKKIRDYEHRIYFDGEAIPVEALDEELKLTIGDMLGQ